MSHFQIIISIIVGLFVLISTAFAAGALWSSKQDKSECIKHSKILWDTIESLKEELAKMSTALAVLTEKIANIQL